MIKPIFRASKLLASTLLLCFALLSLSACDGDDDNDTSTGAQTSQSDGGANSAQYAGTYKGNMRVNYAGNDVNGSDNFPSTLVIHRDGTVTLSTENYTVDGVIGGNQISVVFRVTRNENGANCEGDAIVLATVEGNSLSGPISGEASCKLIVVTRSADLSGTISAQKR